MRKWTGIPREVRSISASAPISQDAFGSILKKSRLSSLPSPIRSNVEKSKALPGQGFNNRKASAKQSKSIHPTHQVITTTPASNYRNDWGLKRPLPTKRSSRFITLNKLDSETGLTDYNSGARYAMVLNRIKEFGQPVQPILPSRSLDNYRTSHNDPFFTPLPASIIKPTESHQTSPTSIKEGDSSRSFINYLQNNNYSPDYVGGLLQDRPKLKAAIRRHVRTQRSRPPSEEEKADFTSDISHEIFCQPMATAGLLYSLPGTLHNRPTAVKVPSTPLFQNTTSITVPRQDGLVVPGRLVNGHGSLANVGGITGSANLVNVDLVEVQNRPLIYDPVQPFTIQSLSVTRQASVDLVVRAISTQSKAHRSRNDKQKKGLLLSKKKKDDNEFLGLVGQSF